MALLGRQRDLLRRAPGFGLLFAATLASGIGTWLAFVALAVDVFDRTGSGVWVSALLVADVMPAIAVGLLLGPLVDRLPRRSLMVSADLARVAVFCALPLVGSAAAIVALAALAGLATGFFRPAVYAGLPNLVDDEDLPGANSLLQAVENLAVTAGPLLGGVLVAASGPRTAYWLNAATFLVSAALIAGIPRRLLQAARAPSEGHRRDLVAGFRVVVRSRALLTVLVAWNVFMVASAGVNVAEVVLAKVSLDSGDFGFGLLVAAGGAGLVAGSVLAGPWLERRRVADVYGGSIALVALGVGAAAAAPNVWAAAPLVALYGVGNGAAVVCNALLVQRGAPDELRGRAFTLLMSSNFGVMTLAMIAAGPLTDALGARWVWAGSAAVAGVAAAVGFSLAKHLGELRGGSARQARTPPVPGEPLVQ